MKRVTIATPVVLCTASLLILAGCEGKTTDGGESAAVKPANVTSENATPETQGDSKVASATTGTRAAGPETNVLNSFGQEQPGDVRARPQKINPADVRLEERFTVNPDGSITKGGGAADRLAARADAKRDATRITNKPNYTEHINEAAPVVVRPEPAEVYLGEVSTGDSGVGSVKLVNSSDQPMTLIECKSSCGCTTTNCPKNQEIPAGGFIELEIRMSAGAMPRESLAKTLTYVVDNHPTVSVPVSCQVVSYIAIEPDVLDTDISLDGTVTLSAIDDQPFVITSMIPPIISEFDTEPAVEHAVEIDWDAFVESGYRGRLTFYTNHPKCRAVYGTIRGIKQREAMAEAAKRRSSGQVAQGPGIEPVQPTARNNQFAPQRVTLTAVDARLHAFTKVEDVESMKQALADGADVGARDTNGKAPLHIAAMEGKVLAVEALLEAGADLEARDRGGRTPLMWAVEARDAGAVHRLLEAGADLAARDETGGNALMWAAGFGNPETLGAILDAEADLAVTDDHGMTPLMWAASFGDGERVKMLIDAGIDVNLVDGTRGCSALMYASRSSGSTEALQALVDAGADLNLVDITGRTALSWAALLGTPEKVQALLNAGSDVLKEDFRGWTPLKYAENRRDRSGPMIVSLLKEATAKAEGEADKAASETSEPIDPQARR